MDEQGASERLLEETKRRLEARRNPTELLRTVGRNVAAVLGSIRYKVQRDPNRELHMACWHGDLRTVNYLLTNENIHVDIDKPGACIGYTVLHHACYNTHGELVRLLLDHNANVNATTRSGDTPLHRICHLWNTNDNGPFDIIKLLLEKGANIDAINMHGRTPLTEACKSGNVRVVRFLLQRGVDVETGNSPVYAATSRGRFDIAELLLENGALLNDPRLDEEQKEIRLSSEHIHAAGPFFARMERDPCLKGHLFLDLDNELSWNELLSSYCRILFANELEELSLCQCPIECLPLLTKCHIPLLTVNMRHTLFHDPSQQVWSALCKLLESNNWIQKVIFNFRGQHREDPGDRHGFASRVMHSLFANSTIVAFSAPSLIPNYTDGKVIITQKDVDCVCLRNKAMPLMMLAGHEPLWPRIFYRIRNTPSAMTAWEASVTFALVRTAVPAFLMALPVDNKRDLS